MLGTWLCAFQTADAVEAIDLRFDIEPGNAHPAACSAMDALLGVKLDSKEAGTIERREESSDRASPRAERPGNEHHSRKKRNQNENFPGKELSENRPKVGVKKR